MRLFLLMLFFILLQSCATVEVTKEVIKAGSSVKTSVQEIINVKEKDEEEAVEKTVETDIEFEKEIIDTEQKKQKQIVKKQQKTLEINFIGDSIDNIKKMLGDPILAREDGNTYMLRFDSESCRLFLFFNINIDNKTVEYYELRNNKGLLFESKAAIDNCYNEFKLS